MYSVLTAVEYLSQMKQFVPIVNAKFSLSLNPDYETVKRHLRNKGN